MGRFSNEHIRRMQGIKAKVGETTTDAYTAGLYQGIMYDFQHVLEKEEMQSVKDTEEYEGLMTAVTRSIGKLKKLVDSHKEQEIDFRDIVDILTNVFENAADMKDYIDENGLNILEPYAFLDNLAEQLGNCEEEPVKPSEPVEPSETVKPVEEQELPRGAGHEHLKNEYDEMRKANQKKSDFKTISESVLDDYNAMFPVREIVRSNEFPSEPEPFEGECPEGMDLEQKAMIDEYNAALYENKKSVWMRKCMQQILYEGTTFELDPSDPDSLITVTGEDECKKLIHAFTGHPFDEFSRPGNEVGHYIAFCEAEGLTADALMDMFRNPDSETSKHTRQLAEEAKKKLFEAGCCLDEDVAIDRVTDFYSSYLPKLTEAEAEFMKDGKCSVIDQAVFSRDWFDTACILHQTLGIHRTPPLESGLKIVNGVDERLSKINPNMTLGNCEKMASKIEMGTSDILYKTEYFSYDNAEKCMKDTHTFFNLLYGQRRMADDIAKYGPSIDTYLADSPMVHIYLNKGYNNVKYLEAVDYLDDPEQKLELYTREFNRSMLTPEKRSAQIQELSSQMGDPKSTLGTFMKELEACDSGFLKLRGSTAFKDMRKAVEKLGKVLDRMPEKPGEEQYKELGDMFAEVQQLSADYLKGKKGVDQNEASNAGRRKNIADKFNAFANIGKAFCHAKADEIEDRRLQKERSRDDFRRDNERNAAANEPSKKQWDAKKSAEARTKAAADKKARAEAKAKADAEAKVKAEEAAAARRKREMAEFAASAKRHEVNEDISAIFDAEVDAMEKLSNDMDSNTLSMDEKTRLCAAVVASKIVHMEVKENGVISGPVSDTLRSVGKDVLIDNYSRMPFVKEYAKDPSKLTVANIKKDIERGFSATPKESEKQPAKVKEAPKETKDINVGRK